MSAKDCSMAHSGSYRIACSHCQTINEIETAWLGRQVRCHQCGKPFTADPPKRPKRQPKEPWLRRIRAAVKHAWALVRDGVTRFVVSPVWLAVLGVAAVVLIVGLVCEFGFWRPEQRIVRSIDDLWLEADEHFRAGRFSSAKAAYGNLATYVQENRQASQSAKDVQLAEAMSSLSAGCLETEVLIQDSPAAGLDERDIAGLDAAVNKVRADAPQVLSKLTEGNEQLSRWAEDFSEEEPPPAPKGPEKPSCYQYSTKQRWNDAIGLLYGRLAQKIAAWEPEIAGWEQGNPPSLPRVTQVGALLDFLRPFQPLDKKTETLFDIAKAKGLFRREVSVFQGLSDTAAKTPNQATILAARDQWEQILQKDRVKAKRVSRVWDDHAARLRSVLQTELQAEVLGDDSPLPGAVDRSSPPLLPLRDFTALAGRTQTNGKGDGEGLVFARVDDRCFALDAQSGEPRWVCRVGFDITWLPRQFSRGDHRRVVLAWDASGSEALTVADEQLTPVWTWRLPQGQSFSGPAMVSGDWLHVLLNTGELYQLEVTDQGVQPRRCLRLPEPAAGASGCRSRRPAPWCQAPIGSRSWSSGKA
jgi:hypothetical protein